MLVVKGDANVFEGQVDVCHSMLMHKQDGLHQLSEDMFDKTFGESV